MRLNFSPEDPLFSVAFHPSEPQFTLGFASGRVECHTYDREKFDATTIAWQTKRHKGSCRSIGYTLDGSQIITCGSDNVVKRCDSSTGKVNAKAETNAPATCIGLSEDYAAIGDESGHLRLFRLEDKLQLHREYSLEPAECISAVCWLPINKHSFACSGDMHVFRIDARKDEVVSVSEDQEDDVVSGCVTSELRSAWGMTEGVVTIWNNRGMEDQQHRIRITKEGSVDTMLAGEIDDHALAGTSDGWVVECDLISGQVLYKARHNPKDEEEDVLCLDYDCEYRLISASMSMLRVWGPNELQEANELQEKKKRKKSSKTKDGKKKKPSGTGMFDDL